MFTFYKYMCIVLIFYGFHQETDATLIPATPKLIVNFFQWAGHLKKLNDILQGEETEKDKEVKRSLTQLSNKVDYINTNVEDTKNIVSRLLELRIQMNSTMTMNTMQEDINFVDSAYENYLKYSKEKKINTMIYNWAILIASTGSIKNIDSCLNNINKYFEIYMNQYINYLDHVKRKNNNCDILGQSHQLTVAFKYYENILREYRGLQTIKYGTAVLVRRGTLTPEEGKEYVKEVESNYDSRIGKMLTNMKKRLPNLSREYVRCGPSSKRFVGEIQAFQSSFISHRIFKSRQCPNEDTVLDFSRNLSHEKLRHGESCSGGIISNCQTDRREFMVCPDYDSNSSRRYKFVVPALDYKNSDVVYGTTTSRRCDNPMIKLSEFPTSRGIDDYRAHPICMCTCSDTTGKKNMINLAPVTSDYMRNKVITGIRFVNVQGVYYFQIQEGVLIPGGGIDETTVQWKKVDINVYNNARIGVKRNKVYLDNIDVVDSTAVLTGIMFEAVGDDSFTIALHYSKFEITNSHVKFIGDWNEWKRSNRNIRREEKKINRELPEYKEFGHQRNVESKREFVKFATTNVEKDIGQTTVPFLDMQDVEPVPHMPLSGAGIYHKVIEGETGGSGFLGIKLYTKDISNS